MRIRNRYTFFMVTWLAVGYLTSVTAQNSADTGAGTTVPTDYFEKITLFSDGRITRFTQMPIRVHISPTLKALPYLAEIRYAMHTWETATDGKIRFEETERAEAADIRVTETDSSRLSFLDTRLGSAELMRLKEGDRQFTVRVILVLEADGTTGELSQAEMRTVCLHEFGHAIGLWGHSPDAADVCHAMATTQYPTQRDINTLLKLYNTPIHTPQHEIAIEVLKKELQTNPRHARPHYLLGAVYFDKGDMGPAIASFQNCLEIDPNFEPARGKLIHAYQKTGQANQAIRLIEQRVAGQKGYRAFRERADSYNHLGTLYYQQGDMDAAIQAFENALERSPHHKAAKRNLHQLLRQKAFTALKHHAFDEATAYFERAIHLDPQNATTYRLMGDGYAHVSQFSKAITHYRKALDIAPDDAEARTNLVRSYNNYGVTLRNNGEWDAAIRAYRNALKEQPTYQLAITNLSDALWQKANAHRQAGQDTPAITTYLELQQLHPEDTTLASLLGELYLKVRDYAAAIAAFHKVYSASPTDKQAQHNLIAAYQQSAQALRNRREYTAALEQLQKAVGLFPTDINLRLSLSQAFQHVGKYEQAREALEHILAQDPANANAKRELVNLQIRQGNALMARKKYAAAVAAFEAIPAAEKTVDMHNMIGYLYLQQGEHLKALATFETLLAKFPKNTVAYQNLRSLESQLVAAVDKARTARRPNTNTGAATPSPETIPRTPDPVVEKLARVQCVLARCLMNRKQPKNAMEKYRLALKAEPYTPALREFLMDTGLWLATQLRKRNDTESYETIVRWATAVDSNFKARLEP